MKKISIIYIDEKPVFVGTILEVDSLKYLELVKQAQENLARLLQDYLDTKKELSNLKDELKKLEEEIKYLKGE